MGEWVSEAPPVAPKPDKDLPEVSHGPWVRSSYDLLDGAHVTEDPDTLPKTFSTSCFHQNRTPPGTLRCDRFIT
jgi:hypothetical protein